MATAPDKPKSVHLRGASRYWVILLPIAQIAAIAWGVWCFYDNLGGVGEMVIALVVATAYHAYSLAKNTIAMDGVWIDLTATKLSHGIGDQTLGEASWDEITELRLGQEAIGGLHYLEIATHSQTVRATVLFAWSSDIRRVRALFGREDTTFVAYPPPVEPLLAQKWFAFTTMLVGIAVAGLALVRHTPGAIGGMALAVVACLIFVAGNPDEPPLPVPAPNLGDHDSIKRALASRDFGVGAVGTFLATAEPIDQGSFRALRGWSSVLPFLFLITPVFRLIALKQYGPIAIVFPFCCAYLYLALRKPKFFTGRVTINTDGSFGLEGEPGIWKRSFGPLILDAISVRQGKRELSFSDKATRVPDSDEEPQTPLPRGQA